MTDVQNSHFDGTCLNCGYQLRGLRNHRCPECGRPFNPSDPTTFCADKPIGPVARWLLKPVGWPVHLATTVVTLLSLWSDVPPGGDFGLMMLAAMGWVAIGAVWAGRLLAWLILYRIFRRHAARPRWRLRPWLVAPSLFAATLLLVAGSVPARLAFWSSRPAMDRLARQAAALPPASKLPDQRIGVYAAYRIETYKGGVRFLVKGTGFLDAWGFAYCATGMPPSLGVSDGYEHWGDDWYVWREGF